MRTPELRRTILRMVGKKEFYGYEIHQALAEEGIKIGIGRLYAILGEMKANGLLKDRWEKSESGPNRRVYTVAPKGGRERDLILMDAIKTVHDFYNEYLMELPPELSAFRQVANLLAKGTGKEINIGFVAAGISGSMKRLIQELQERRPKANIYVIRPRTSTSDIDIEGIQALDGKMDDVPMKDGYLSLLCVIGNIKKDSLDACLREWGRAIHPKGKIAIVIPTALFAEYKDPLGIGEFIEMREHPPAEQEHHLRIGILKNALQKHFGEIKENKVVHITVLTVSRSISK